MVMDGKASSLVMVSMPCESLKPALIAPLRATTVSFGSLEASPFTVKTIA